jgi:hypothetical protein
VRHETEGAHKTPRERLAKNDEISAPKRARHTEFDRIEAPYFTQTSQVAHIGDLGTGVDGDGG